VLLVIVTCEFLRLLPVDIPLHSALHFVLRNVPNSLFDAHAEGALYFPRAILFLCSRSMLTTHIVAWICPQFVAPQMQRTYGF